MRNKDPLDLVEGDKMDPAELAALVTAVCHPGNMISFWIDRTTGERCIKISKLPADGGWDHEKQVVRKGAHEPDCALAALLERLR